MSISASDVGQFMQSSSTDKHHPNRDIRRLAEDVT